jgi:hypothetical protein
LIVLSLDDEETRLHSMVALRRIFEGPLAGSVLAPVNREGAENDGRLLAGKLSVLDGRLLPALIG